MDIQGYLFINIYHVKGCGPRTGQGAKLLSFRVSGTPKNTVGNPIFYKGFRLDTM